MNLAERAYLAGIVDGEGTVTLVRVHRKQTPYPEVSIANTDLNLLNWIKAKVKCGIIVKKKKKSDKHNQAFTFKIRGDKALLLLRELKSFLIVKNPHAQLLIEKYKACTPRNGKYTERQIKDKTDLLAEIRKLNS